MLLHFQMLTLKIPNVLHAACGQRQVNVDPHLLAVRFGSSFA